MSLEAKQNDVARPAMALLLMLHHPAARRIMQPACMHTQHILRVA